MKVLDGINIVDFTTFLAGPYLGRLLADFGANVIKVEGEMPESYRALGFAFASQNRNKRSLSVDMKKTEGKEIVTTLIKKADIIVENSRPGVMQRLGFDYESCRKLNPDIIYISASGWGSSGPLSELPGLDPVIAALSGLMVSTCGPDNPPIYPRCNFSDVGVSALGAFGAALALLDRQRTGKGQRVQTSLLQAALALNSHIAIDYPGIVRNYVDSMYPKGSSAVSRLYCGVDGKWFFVDCRTEDDWVNLCKSTYQEYLLKDPRFAAPAARKQNDNALQKILEEHLALTATESWLEVFRKNNVPSMPAPYEQDIYSDPYFAETDVFIEQDHPDLGHAKLVGFPAEFSNMENVLTRRAPLLGEQTAEILAELGYTQDRIDGLKKNKVVFW